MNWLIWKEYRLNRLILIVGAVLLLAPHVVALVLSLRGVGPVWGPGVSHWSFNFMMAAIYSLVLSQLTVALLGGHAIACERADRSAEFLAYLPVARGRILAGKLAVALAAVAVIWVPNLVIMLLTWGDVPRRGAFEYFWIGPGAFAVTGLAFFGVGWLLSSMLESPTFSICGGLVTPYLLWMALFLLVWWFDWPGDVAGEVLLWGYLLTCLVLGVACFVVGTWYYLRRVEP